MCCTSVSVQACLSLDLDASALNRDVRVTLHGGSGARTILLLGRSVSFCKKVKRPKRNMAATYQVPPPECFNFSRPEEWMKWSRRFERFRKASGLNEKAQETQVNTLIYSMGDQADDILRSFALSEEERTQYSTVIAKFEAHFVKRRNVIYKRARFNNRRQEEGESVDSFITELYSLAEHCGYGELHDKMIRDRIVVGIRNAKLSERLQMDPELNLDKAVAQVRQSEQVKQQQSLLRTSTGNLVGAVTHRGRRKLSQHGSRKQPDSTTCTRCGRHPKHDQSHCPAKDAECRKCGKKGHFQAMCKTKIKSGIGGVQGGDDKNSADAFMGAVDGLRPSNPWNIQLQINNTPMEFCMDTGAEVSVISQQAHKVVGSPPLEKPDRTLRGPDSHVLPVSGQFTATVKLKTKEIRERMYVVKGLNKPLLGRPAIEKLELLRSVATVSNSDVSPQSKTPIEEFPELFQGLGKLRGDHVIKLQEGAKPFAQSTPRRVAIPLMDEVKKELQRMEDQGVISRVTEATEWCAGMVVVPKENGKVRICVDLTHLNQSVCRERHLLHTVDESLAQLAGAKVFSKLDANSGFWQVPLAPESALLTTFITPFGRFCFQRLPFGITSAPEHFQRRMSEILEGLSGVVNQVDDILVHGKDQQERLQRVLKRLVEAGVTLNREKCHFSVNSVKFLGQVIDADGIRPDPSKIEAINNMEAPSNIGEVRRFLGVMNQMSKFCPNLANLTQPIRDLLVKGTQWVWGEPQQTAFDSAKETLVRSPALALFDANLKTVVAADASSFGLGAVLLQEQCSGVVKPVAYISRSMTQRYAQIEKEALAFTWACERLSDYLTGLTFHIHTDHKPLVPLFSSKQLDQLPVRIQRFRLRMMRFQFTISHVPGKELTIADTLSRAPTGKPSPADYLLEQEVSAYVSVVMQTLPATESRLQEIKELQAKDEVCQKVYHYCLTGWPAKNKMDPVLRPYHSVANELSVDNGLILRGNRVIIPPPLRKEMLSRIHTGHQGIVKCREKARQSVWWPLMSKELEELVRSCTECCKAQQQRAQPLIPSALPELPWQKVASDLFHWNQKTYLLLVDYFSRYVEIARLDQLTANEVINHTKSIFARHGIPEEVVTDNGPQYASQAYSEFAETYQFKHITSSPYFAQSNGEAERAVGTVKSLLKKSSDPHLALLAYRSTPLSNGHSPSELLMCRTLRTTVPTTRHQRRPKLPDVELLRKKEDSLKRRQKENFDKHHGVRELEPLDPGDEVWISNRGSKGVVEGEVQERSYEVTSRDGTFRRNRKT